jgi:hypothetical protein
MKTVETCFQKTGENGQKMETLFHLDREYQVQQVLQIMGKNRNKCCALKPSGKKPIHPSPNPMTNKKELSKRIAGQNVYSILA